MQTLFVAKRPFDPSVGDGWDRYVAWSGLSQLREVVSLDTMLCPTVPEELTAADWDYNVHADYLVFFFRSIDCLLSRVTADGRLNILAVLQNPTAADLAGVTLSGFAFAGFDLVDVHGDVSALTNCGGFEGVFVNAELSELGLLTDLSRAQEVQALTLRFAPGQAATEPHPRYVVTGGTVTYDYTHTYYDCTFSAPAITFEVTEEVSLDSELTFDTTVDPVRYSGVIYSQGPEFEVVEDCGDGGSTRTHRAANTWLLVESGEARTVSGDRRSIVGAYRVESGVGFFVESNYTITRTQ